MKLTNFRERRHVAFNLVKDRAIASSEVILLTLVDDMQEHIDYLENIMNQMGDLSKLYGESK